MAEQDFQGYYRTLADSELLSIAEDWNSLVDEAKSALATELTRRGIDIHEAPSGC